MGPTTCSPPWMTAHKIAQVCLTSSTLCTVIIGLVNHHRHNNTGPSRVTSQSEEGRKSQTAHANRDGSTCTCPCTSVNVSSIATCQAVKESITNFHFTWLTAALVGGISRIKHSVTVCSHTGDWQTLKRDWASWYKVFLFHSEECLFGGTRAAACSMLI